MQRVWGGARHLHLQQVPREAGAGCCPSFRHWLFPRLLLGIKGNIGELPIFMLFCLAGGVEDEDSFPGFFLPLTQSLELLLSFLGCYTYPLILTPTIGVPSPNSQIPTRI